MNSFYNNVPDRDTIYTFGKETLKSHCKNMKKIINPFLDLSLDSIRSLAQLERLCGFFVVIVLAMFCLWTMIENGALKRTNNNQKKRLGVFEKKKQAKDRAEKAAEKENYSTPNKKRKEVVYNKGMSNMSQEAFDIFGKLFEESPKSKSKMTHCPAIGSSHQRKIEGAGFNSLMALMGVYLSMDEKGRTSQDRNNRFISWLAELGIRTDHRSTITHCIADQAELHFNLLEDK